MNRHFFFLLVTIHLLFFTSIHFGVNEAVSSSDEVDQFWQSFNQIEEYSTQRYLTIGNQIQQITERLPNNSSICYQLIVNAFQTAITQEWSAQLINSNSFTNADFLSNLIVEQYSSLGNFDQCLALGTVHQQVNTAFIHFTGKYCLVTIETPACSSQLGECEDRRGQLNESTNYLHSIGHKWLSIHNRFPLLAGICIPSVCTEAELNVLIENYFKKYLNGLSINVNYCQDVNSTESKRSSSFGYIISKYLLLSTICISAFCTLIHRKCTSAYPKNVLLNQLLSSFDISLNIQSLFTTELPLKSNCSRLQYVNGIKCIFTFAAVLVHSQLNILLTYLASISLFTNYPSYYLKMLFTPSECGGFNLQQHSPIGLQVFFILSGFLNAYSTLTKSSKPPIFLPYVFHRYLTLIPAVAGTLALTILFQNLGSGPLFHTTLTDPYVAPCYNYWWTHLLLINNFWKINQMCGVNLWFLAALFQLYIISYVVLYLHYNQKLLSYITCLVFCSVTSLYVLSLVLLNIAGIPNFFFHLNFQYLPPLDAIRLVYTWPFSHFCPYFCGILVGLLLVDLKDNLTISLKFYHLFTIFTFTSFFYFGTFPVLSSYETDENENKQLPYVVGFGLITYYTSAFTALFLLFTGLIEAKKTTTAIRRFLEHQVFVPLNRLALAIYLVNGITYWFNAHQYRQTPTLTVPFLINWILLIFMQTLALAIFLYLFIQKPFQNIQKLFF